jgi:hypothetical protein
MRSRRPAAWQAVHARGPDSWSSCDGGSHAAAGAPEPSLPVAYSTYKDEVNGFELDYPADWSVSPNQQLGSRGSQAGLFSPGSTAEAVAPGGARLMITVYEWDPKDDLAAYVEHRRVAWDASGFTVRNGSMSQRVDGRPASDFFVETTDACYSSRATIGQHTRLSGEGDLVILKLSPERWPPGYTQ